VTPKGQGRDHIIFEVPYLHNGDISDMAPYGDGDGHGHNEPLIVNCW